MQSAPFFLACFLVSTACADPLVETVRSLAKPIATCEPGADSADLEPLRGIVGNARIVALGEGTVGTREFVQLRHRITAFLADNMGFTTVALVANMPETRALDDYIRTGKGDPRALLSALKSWPLDTEEMLQFVQWMRSANAAGKPYRLVGIDMVKPDVPVEVVRNYLRLADPAGADSLEAVAAAISRARQSVANFVTARAELPAGAVAGHHVRLSGSIRTGGVTDYAGLWMRADAQGGTVAFDNMEHQHVTGTRDWRRYEITLDIPANADLVPFGVLLGGTGTAWFDSLAVEIDGKPWSAPGLDLALESAAGFDLAPPPGYECRMDDSSPAAGRSSLRLGSVAGFVRPDPRQLWVEAEGKAEALVQRLKNRRAPTDQNAAWAERNAELLVQRTRAQFRDEALDSSRVANLEWWLLRRPPGSRAVLWGHNDDVSRASGTLGDRLDTRYGKNLVVIGMATGTGQCTTTHTTSANLEATELAPGPTGSFESLADAAGIPRFLLDLRGDGSPWMASLREPLLLRSIRNVTPKNQFHDVNLMHDFNAIVWIRETGPTHPVKLH